MDIEEKEEGEYFGQRLTFLSIMPVRYLVLEHF